MTADLGAGPFAERVNGKNSSGCRDMLNRLSELYLYTLYIDA